MRALTLTQPWASLVALGQKRIETRSWSTPYRGPVAIHAAKGLQSIGGEAALPGLCYQEPFRQALFGDVWYPPGRIFELIPRGVVVAVVDLVDVTKTGEAWSVQPDERELAFGDYAPGRFAWVLDNLRRLEAPLPCRGALGLWTLPVEIERSL